MHSRRKTNITYTVTHGICTGCGICQSACPVSAINMNVDNGEYVPIVDVNKCKSGKGCHRCFDVCPGWGCHLINEAEKLFQDNHIQEDKYIGRFLNCYVGYSNNEKLRYHAASGGLVSQFLIWLLETNKIDGAVVTRFDKNTPLKFKTIIATNKDDILSAKSSKYSPVTFINITKELKEALGTRFIVVGLPCHIEGMRKLMDKDKRLREKICGLFAVYCSGTRTFNFTEYIFKSRGMKIENVDYLSYRDNGCLGGMVVKGKGIDYYEDYQRYSHPLRTIFYPRRCLLCADHFGELADVCFGDIHVKPYSDDTIGVNSIVVRNRFWDLMLKQACKDGAVTLNDLDEQVLLASQKMAKVKKSRNIAYGLLINKMGGVAPDYGSTYDATINIKVVVNYIRMSIERYIGRHKNLWWIIPFIKSKVNIY